MRVAIFTDNDFDKVNGVTTTLKALLTWANQGDVRARIYTAADLETDTPEYFAAQALSIGLPFYRDMRVYWPRLRNLVNAVTRDGADVIHVTTPGPVGLAGRRIARALRLPIVGSYHTHLGEYLGVLSGSRRLGRWFEQYVRWFYSTSGTLLAPSAATCDMLAQAGYARDTLKVWARGVDTIAFCGERRSADLRASWHVDHRRPAILYAGRLSREKGLDIVAPLQRYLERRRVAHQFVFLGDGPMSTELRRLCPDAVFLGTLPHDQVGAVMASADVFLFPSATDSLGNVVLEAQASGLPVIVSDRGGPRENMVPGVTGSVAAAGDVDAFGVWTMDLLREHERRRQMAAAARAFAETRSWRAAMRPLVETWQLAARGPAAISGAGLHAPNSTAAVTAR